MLLAFEQIVLKQLYSSNASLLNATIIIRLYKYIPHLSVACAMRRLATQYVCNNRIGQSSIDGAFLLHVTAKIMRSPNPQQRLDQQGCLVFVAYPFTHVLRNSRNLAAFTNSIDASDLDVAAGRNIGAVVKKNLRTTFVYNEPGSAGIGLVNRHTCSHSRFVRRPTFRDSMQAPAACVVDTPHTMR